MSSWRTPTQGLQQQQENGPRAKCDQVVFEAIAKAAEIVVGSRCWIDHPIASSSNSSSSRFNLLVPEVQGVRSILQRWKRALHVPLRLDVYYQHADSRRELLERWCLEYAPKGSHGFPSAATSADPIVQLRQVCKQIVIWLRSLYCWSRVLPAQVLRVRANNTSQSSCSKIGFSIYVVSEGNDDVSGLVSNQGFSSQGQPHSVLTPYGELGWRVFYAPKSMIHRLVPEKPAYPNQPSSPFSSSKKATKSKSQPIPMNKQQQQQQQQTSPNVSQARTHTEKQHNMLLKRESTPPSTVQSAPQRRMYHRSHSDVGGETTTQYLQKPMMKMRSNSGLPSFLKDEETTLSSIIADDNNKPRPPTKTLSALSLAIMQNDEDVNNNNNNNQKDLSAPHQPETPTSTTDNQAAEKRRAALHHAPPQFSPHTQSPIMSPIMKRSLTSAGEYGYGYNNHIPTLHRNPSNSSNHSRQGPDDNRYLTASPLTPSAAPLATTPPGMGFLYGGPTPPVVVPSNLIPPRSSVTPPFVRPMGFVGEPPSQPLPPPVTAAMSSQMMQMQLQQTTTPMIQHRTTSLDLLHSSPFQQPPHGSIFSNGSSSLPPWSQENPFAMSNDLPTGLLDPRYDDYDEDHDDMPFAVDTGPTLTPDASAVVASFASTKRLALFNNNNSNNNSSHHNNQGAQPAPNEEDVMNSLADQLAEFKSFGASLMVESTTN